MLLQSEGQLMRVCIEDQRPRLIVPHIFLRKIDKNSV